VSGLCQKAFSNRILGRFLKSHLFLSTEFALGQPTLRGQRDAAG
jgi:hypothetical protein